MGIIDGMGVTFDGIEGGELADTKRRLAKAEHDRARYARRIRFLQARHEALSRALRAALVEKDELRSALRARENG